MFIIVQFFIPILSYFKWYKLTEGRMREPDLQSEGENVAILLTIKLKE